MKYLCILEISQDEFEKIAEQDQRLQTERELNPGKYPKKIGSDYAILGSLPRLTETPNATWVCFVTYEADTPEQLAELSALYASQSPEVKTHKRWLLPIIELGPFMDKLKEHSHEPPST